MKRTPFPAGLNQAQSTLTSNLRASAMSFVPRTLGPEEGKQGPGASPIAVLSEQTSGLWDDALRQESAVQGFIRSASKEIENGAGNNAPERDELPMKQPADEGRRQGRRGQCKAEESGRGEVLLAELGLLPESGHHQETATVAPETNLGNPLDQKPAEKSVQEAFRDPREPQLPMGSSADMGEAKVNPSLRDLSLRSPGRSWQSAQTVRNVAEKADQNTSTSQHHENGLAVSKGLWVPEGKAEPGGWGGAPVATVSGKSHCGGRYGQRGGQAAASPRKVSAIHQGPWDEVCHDTEPGQRWRQHGTAVHFSRCASGEYPAGTSDDGWEDHHDRVTALHCRPHDPSSRCPSPPGRPRAFLQAQKRKPICSVPALMDAVDQAGGYGLLK